MKFATVITVALAVALLVSGCSGGADDGGDNVLRVGNGAEPEDLDPHTTTGVPAHSLQLALFEGLVLQDPETLASVPGAAETWNVSNQGRIYMFRLRKTAKWSNGNPVTAHDFVYSWQRVLSPKLGAEYAYMLYPLKNAKAFNEGEIADFSKVGVEAIDDYILEVTLENPTPYFLELQTHNSWFPVHRPTIERFGAMDERGTRWTRAGNLVGNGPFRLAEWSPNEVISMVRNEHYWNVNNVRLDGIEFYPIHNVQTEERSFRSGELHLTESVPLHKVQVYREERPEVLNLDPWLGTYFYRMNITRVPFTDKRVRRAFSMALDREELARSVLKGGEPPAFFYTPPGLAGYTCEYRLPFDVERARELLVKAGYPNGEGIPHVEILYNTSEQHRTIAEAIQQMWKKNLNVDVQLLNQDWKVFLATEKNLNYWITRGSWIGDVADPINFLECFLSGGGNNRTGFSSLEFDGLLSRAYAESDRIKRLDYLQQAEAILLGEAVIMPIYFYTMKYLKAPELKGMPSNIMRYRRWDKVYLEPAEK